MLHTLEIILLNSLGLSFVWIQTSDLKHGPLTGPKAVLMAEWNAYYRNEDDEEGQDDGEEAGGETTVLRAKYKQSQVIPLSLIYATFLCFPLP